MLSPYQFASNTPIQAIDLDGLEAVFAPYIGKNLKNGVIRVSNSITVQGYGQPAAIHRLTLLTLTHRNVQSGKATSTTFNPYGITQQGAQGTFLQKVGSVLTDPFALFYIDAGSFMRRLTQTHGFPSDEEGREKWSIVNHIAQKMLSNSGGTANAKIHENIFIHFVGQVFGSAIYGENAAKFVADIHERYKQPYENIASENLEGISNNSIYDMYTDLINNEYGRQFGTQIAQKYDLNSNTRWTTNLSKNVLNDIQNYFSNSFPEMKFKENCEEDIFIKDFTNFMNDKIMPMRIQNIK